MKVNKSKLYVSLFAMVLFLQLYLPSFKLNIFLQIAVLGFYFLLEKPIVTATSLKIFVPIVALFFIAFIGTFTHHYAFFNISKDIFHFLKPITGLMIGFLFFKTVNNFKLFLQTIVITSIVSAIVHFFTILFFSSTDSVEEIREFSKDNFLELFGLFFLIFYPRFQNMPLFEKKRLVTIFKATLILSILLYFSRTMLICAVILLFSIYGSMQINTKTIKRLGVLLILLIGFYAYLFSINLDRTKGFQAFMYKVRLAPSEIFNSKIDRDNHKDLWDHWRAYEAKRALFLMKDHPTSFIVGTGHGPLVNLKFFAPLTGEPKGMKYISELHNGYIFIFYKTGIVGIIIYFILLLRLYLITYDRRTMTTVFIAAIGIIYFITTLIITGIYNARDVIIFILGALLAFYKHQNSADEQTA